MGKFKAYRIREIEKKAVAGFEELSLEELDRGEVVIRVAYSSVNYKDALAATGAGKIIRRFPCIGGIDLSGTVTESADTRFARGDAVICTSYDLGVAHDGGYSEYARVPADWVVPMPKGMNFFEAMALGTAGYTAALAIVRMEANGLAPANGPVIVSGATGGVGPIAVDVLSRLGYRAVALTGKEHDAAGRNHRYDRPCGEHESEYFGGALHPAGSEPPGDRLRSHADAPAPGGLAAARRRHAAGAPRGDDADPRVRRSPAGVRWSAERRGQGTHRGRSGGLT